MRQLRAHPVLVVGARFFMFQKTLAALACLLFFDWCVGGGAALAMQTVIVLWNANSEPDVVGYRLLYGTESGMYTRQIDVADPMAVVTDLTVGETYYFAAVAYNEGGLESLPSTEISYTPGSQMHELANISTRARVEEGENVIIGGFIITGDIPRRIVLRGLGPSLARSGIQNPASDPVITLFSSVGTVLAYNDDWDSNDPSVVATGLAPTEAVESFLMATLPAGAYTTMLRSKGTSGPALFELYQLDSSATTRAVNLSTRGRVGSGEDVMIAGFILTGNEAARIGLRALGPSLAGAGISDPLADPELELYDGNGSLMFRNDNWRSDQETEILEAGIAPGAEQEAAMIATLPGGNYSAVARGGNGSEGVGLIDIYDVP